MRDAQIGRQSKYIWFLKIAFRYKNPCGNYLLKDVSIVWIYVYQELTAEVLEILTANKKQLLHYWNIRYYRTKMKTVGTRVRKSHKITEGIHKL